MTDHHAFDRAADEIEAGLLCYAPETAVALLAEVMARILAANEAMPDVKFLHVVQNRVIAIATEGNVSRETGH